MASQQGIGELEFSGRPARPCAIAEAGAPAPVGSTGSTGGRSGGGCTGRGRTAGGRTCGHSSGRGARHDSCWANPIARRAHAGLDRGDRDVAIGLVRSEGSRSESTRPREAHVLATQASPRRPRYTFAASEAGLSAEAVVSRIDAAAPGAYRGRGGLVAASRNHRQPAASAGAAAHALAAPTTVG